MRSLKTLAKVFASCCSSAFLMEILMVKKPETANLVTFLQFFFISLYGFIFISKFGTIKSKIPLKQYTILVGLFFVTSVANNYVYALHVPSTLHMIIRSASSPASMLVYCYAKKQYPRVNNLFGSILISIGVALATYGGAPTKENTGRFLYWCVGVGILLSSLITGAYTGLQQELLYGKYGKHPDEILFPTKWKENWKGNWKGNRQRSIAWGDRMERTIDGTTPHENTYGNNSEVLKKNTPTKFKTQMLFYTHALPLPFFFSIYPQLQQTSTNLTTEIWLLISLNIIAQFYCTHSVHELATKETSVTVTFILTVRKFVSLLISSIVFKNNLTWFHVLGTVLVVLGTCVYFDFFAKRKQVPVSLKKD